MAFKECDRCSRYKKYDCNPECQVVLSATNGLYPVVTDGDHDWRIIGIFETEQEAIDCASVDIERYIVRDRDVDFYSLQLRMRRSRQWQKDLSKQK